MYAKTDRNPGAAVREGGDDDRVNLFPSRMRHGRLVDAVDHQQRDDGRTMPPGWRDPNVRRGA